MSVSRLTHAAASPDWMVPVLNRPDGVCVLRTWASQRARKASSASLGAAVRVKTPTSRGIRAFGSGRVVGCGSVPRAQDSRSGLARSTGSQRPVFETAHVCEHGGAVVEQALQLTRRGIL